MTYEKLDGMFGITQLMQQNTEERNRLDALIYDCQKAAGCVEYPTPDLPKIIAALVERNKELVDALQLLRSLTPVEDYARIRWFDVVLAKNGGKP